MFLKVYLSARSWFLKYKMTNNSSLHPLRSNTHTTSTILQIDSTEMTFLRDGDDSKICKQVKGVEK
jgi:hypothetical protein